MKKVVGIVAASLSLALLVTFIIWVGRTSKVDLFKAVGNNDPSLVRRALVGGENPDVMDNVGNTPISLAAREGFVDCAKALLEGGARINVHGAYGNTPLHDAAGKDRVEMVKFLLDNGADVNARNSFGETPLCRAIPCFGVGTVEALLDGGDRVDSRDVNGRTPLFLAIKYGHNGIVELLLQHGADPRARDSSGKTPLDEAAGRKSTMDLLLHYDKNSVRNEGGEGQEPFLPQTGSFSRSPAMTRPPAATRSTR